MRAWHFVREDRRLGYGCGLPVEPGYLYEYHATPVLCHAGLHASIKPLDALRYAPGPVVCRVECGGTVIHGGDKLVCTSREVLWVADATDTLRHFSRLCALDVIHLWDAPDVVVRFLKTGDEALRAAAWAAAGAAAWAAAGAAVDDAARDAARAAAWDAAWDAARAAAWDAAWDAARAAAWDAAWDAAGAAARDAQNKRLHRMLTQLGRSA